MKAGKKCTTFIFSLAFVLILVPIASAAPVIPASYDMMNGYGEAYNKYWDKEYDGQGSTTTTGAQLSGGKGNLTDGVIAALNWNHVENREGTGPYVGWRVDPAITFHFASTTEIDTVNLFVDDADGLGSVSLPKKVQISMSGVTRTFSVDELDSAEPKQLIFDSLDLTGDTLEIIIFRKKGFVFVSEVTFDSSPQVAATAAPLPASLLFLGTGLFGLAFVRSRSK